MYTFAVNPSKYELDRTHKSTGYIHASFFPQKHKINATLVNDISSLSNVTNIKEVIEKHVYHITNIKLLISNHSLSTYISSLKQKGGALKIVNILKIHSFAFKI
jgi:hypothetical protein